MENSPWSAPDLSSGEGEGDWEGSWRMSQGQLSRQQPRWRMGRHNPFVSCLPLLDSHTLIKRHFHSVPAPVASQCFVPFDSPAQTLLFSPAGVCHCAQQQSCPSHPI